MGTIQAFFRDKEVAPAYLRENGFIPCIIYGSGLEKSLCIQIYSSDARQIRKTKIKGSSVYIQIGRYCYHTLLKELDYDNITTEIIHIGFQFIDKLN